MNWIETLYRTFEANSAQIGNPNDRIPLAPIGHTVQNTHIEITVDQDGRFVGARADSLVTIIPCTESSAGRTNSPVAHPLSDKLKYIASDYFSLTGESRRKPPKKGERKDPHAEYRKALSEWINSEFNDPKLIAIDSYLQSNDGRVLEDLCKSGIYPLDENGKIQKKWSGEKTSQPPIYALTKNSPAPWDAFIRWRVAIPGVLEDRTYFDEELWSKWISFCSSRHTKSGFCYVLGEQTTLASSHPKRMRSVADGAKLISSNDSDGFTFRGRFTDPDGDQVCSVSFDVTQKAHNALRWLIARQGRRDGDQAIVAWAVSGKIIPSIVDDSFSLLSEEPDNEAAMTIPAAEEGEAPVNAEVAQDYALRLKVKISGYQTELGDSDQIVVMALDAATPGRMAITYYREITSSEFLERLESWHEDCAWFQNFGAKRHFVGTPAPKDIAACAYGTRLDEKLLASTYRRLLPCILESAAVPSDLVDSCVRRATARLSMEPWEWNKSLGIACSLYRKQQTQLKHHHHHPMALERDRTNRNYLYGRLLAVADHLESGAIRNAGEKRESSAARLMQRFADYPFSTWRTIELSLTPYQQRLKANSPGLLARYENEFTEIMDLFTSENFANDTRLTGEFLLAYHTQRNALWTKESKADETQVN